METKYFSSETWGSCAGQHKNILQICVFSIIWRHYVICLGFYEENIVSLIARMHSIEIVLRWSFAPSFFIASCMIENILIQGIEVGSRRVMLFMEISWSN